MKRIFAIQLVGAVILLLLIPSSSRAANYERVLDDKGQVRTDMVRRVADGAFIPVDPENRDYKLYLAQQKAGTAVLKTPIIPPADPTKIQAKLDLNDKTKTADQRLDALITLLDLK